MNGLLNLLFGYIVLELHGEGALQLVNTLNGEGVRLFGVRAGDGFYSICCSVFKADSVKKRLDSLGADYRVSECRGLPFIAFRYKNRIGLLVGALLAAIIIGGSAHVLWDVRLECNGEFDENAVYASLEKLGVHAGKRIATLDVYNAEHMFLIQNPRFSDVAINIQGTVAAVKLRLRTEAPRQEEKSGVYNVVAAEAGVIRSVTATRGVPVVKRGDTVAEGDVLISGIMQGAYGEYYLHHAYGSVTATVFRKCRIVIPLCTAEKRYTGNSVTKKAYIVVGKRFDLFYDELAPYELCEAESTKSKLTLCGVRLPVVSESVTYKEYTLTERVLSIDEAHSEATAAFAAYIERELDGEVVNTQTDISYDPELDAVVLEGAVELITEIGVETEITEALPE